jgi:RimJ/RimL family protein N-acetyltransferase
MNESTTTGPSDPSLAPSVVNAPPRWLLSETANVPLAAEVRACRRSGRGEVRLFELAPARLPEDLTLLHGWMNDPAVAAYWELAGPIERTRAHVAERIACEDAVPCVGLLFGNPMSYWEIYRADRDELARHVPCEPHDIGLHLLIGPESSRGKRLGSLLLDSVANWVLAIEPRAERVIAEPDVRNTASIKAFTNAGFVPSGVVSLPEKNALLMVRTRRPEESRRRVS